MKKIKVCLQFFSLFCLIAVISGCASAYQYVPLPDQSKEVESPEKGRIYVLRPSSFGSAISMTVNDKDKEIGVTGPKSFLCWERSPGETTIYSSSENTSELSLDVSQGDVYYVLQKPQMGLIVARSKIELVDDEMGEGYLKKCKPPRMKAK